jgi:hypothetical protein
MTSLLAMAYTYDAASNRLSLATSDDAFDYALDAVGRLRREAQNTFVEDGFEYFATGTVDGAAVDATDNSVKLLEYADAFDGGLIQADRWQALYAGAGYVGLDVRVDGALTIAFPRGFSNLMSNVDDPPVHDDYGIVNSAVGMSLQHRTLLSGDFDVQVDFSDFQGQPTGAGTPTLAALVVNVGSFDSSDTYAVMGIDNLNPGYRGLVINGGSNVLDHHLTSGDTAGKLRLARSGSTIDLSYWDGSAWVLEWSYGSWSTDDAYATLYFSCTSGVLAINFSNFTNNSPSRRTPSPAPTHRPSTTPVGRWAGETSIGAPPRRARAA